MAERGRGLPGQRVDPRRRRDGKVIVPIVGNGGGTWHAEIHHEPVTVDSEESLGELRKQIRMMGRYDLIVTAAEERDLAQDPAAVPEAAASVTWARASTRASSPRSAGGGGRAGSPDPGTRRQPGAGRRSEGGELCPIRRGPHLRASRRLADAVVRPVDAHAVADASRALRGRDQRRAPRPRVKPRDLPCSTSTARRSTHISTRRPSSTPSCVPWSTPAESGRRPQARPRFVS